MKPLEIGYCIYVLFGRELEEQAEGGADKAHMGWKEDDRARDSAVLFF